MQGLLASLMEAAAFWSPVCPVRALFGVTCPGCGLTRALTLCAQGQVLAAMALNPMAPVLALQAIGWSLARGLSCRRAWDSSSIERRYLQFDVVALPTIWAIRSLMEMLLARR